MYLSLKNARPARPKLRGARMVPLLLMAVVLSACSGRPPVPETDPGADLADAQAGRLNQPGEPYWPYQLASYYAGTGNPVQAHAQLDTALVLDGAYEPAIALRSKLFFEEGHHQPAIDLLRSHLENHPEFRRRVVRRSGPASGCHRRLGRI